MLCSNCKMHLEDSAKFCPRCGRSVAGAQREIVTLPSGDEAKEVIKPQINFGYSKMKYYKTASIICTIAVVVLMLFSGGSDTETDFLSIRIAYSSSKAILLVMFLLSVAALGTMLIGGIVYIIKALSAGDNPTNTRFVDSGETCMKVSFVCDAIVVVWLLLGYDVIALGDILMLTVIGVNGFVLIPKYREGIEENRSWKKKYEGSAFAVSGEIYKEKAQPNVYKSQLTKATDTGIEGWVCKKCGRLNQRLEQSCKDCGASR